MGCKGVANPVVCAQFPHMWLNQLHNYVYRVVVDGWEMDLSKEFFEEIEI